MDDENDDDDDRDSALKLEESEEIQVRDIRYNLESLISNQLLTLKYPHDGDNSKVKIEVTDHKRCV